MGYEAIDNMFCIVIDQDDEVQGSGLEEEEDPACGVGVGPWEPATALG